MEGRERAGEERKERGREDKWIRDESRPTFLKVPTPL